jgi:hypothetical protein
MVENTASLPIVMLVTIGVAFWRRWRGLPRFWLWLAVGFAALALGPFVNVGGINTYIPGPWAVLRYVPLIGSARMPGRLAVLVILAVSVLFAIAWARLVARHPRPWLSSVALGTLLLVELAPQPRTLYDARVPAVYERIRADPRDLRVLELPFGVRDGLATLGAFDPASQYYQTFHEKPILGGYISRLPSDAVDLHRRDPLLRTLMRLSVGDAGTPVDLETIQHAQQSARTSQVGYVVVDSSRVSPELRAFAIRVFELVKVAEADGRELYQTGLGLSLAEPDSETVRRFY